MQPKGFDSEGVSFSGDCGMVSLTGAVAKDLRRRCRCLAVGIDDLMPKRSVAIPPGAVGSLAIGLLCNR